MYKTKTLPRLATDNYNMRELQVSAPLTAPIVHSDGYAMDRNVFDYTKTLSRSDSKVIMRRRMGNSLANRKTRNSLLIGGSVRDSGDYFKQLLIEAENLRRCCFPCIRDTRSRCCCCCCCCYYCCPYTPFCLAIVMLF